MREFIITELPSDVTYEFRICGVNDYGRGAWGDVSEVIILPNPNEEHPPTSLLLSVPEVLELREGYDMEKEDKYNLPSRPLDVSTNLTPRLIESNEDTSIPTNIRWKPTTDDSYTTIPPRGFIFLIQMSNLICWNILFVVSF